MRAKKLRVKWKVSGEITFVSKNGTEERVRVQMDQIDEYKVRPNQDIEGVDLIDERGWTAFGVPFSNIEVQRKRYIIPISFVLEVEQCDFSEKMPPTKEVEESVKEAIENALDRAHENGFDHPLSDKVAIDFGHIDGHVRFEGEVP